ncbi:MAG: carbohydrate-binding protein [Blastocatellia bacterium]
MRKHIVGESRPQNPPSNQGWLHLEDIASVELTSEDAAHPIEAALLPGATSGWRAEGPGEQTVRLIFDEPQRLERIHLRFEETAKARTQEFVLRWSDDGGHLLREIVRQQWNFSPPVTTEEIEDYRVDLSGVRVLELTIIPDIGGGETRASLRQMGLA